MKNCVQTEFLLQNFEVLFCDTVLLQGEVERLRGSEARNNTALQSLRQRLTELEGASRGGEEMRLSELHTEIGRLKKTLQQKVKKLKTLKNSYVVSLAFSGRG